MIYLLLCILFIGSISCRSFTPDDSKISQYQKIDLPFKSKPETSKQFQNPFVIRTIADNIEYVIEIPSAGEDYNIEIPIAQLKKSFPKVKDFIKERNLSSTSATDKEMLKDLPKSFLKEEKEINDLDRVFGVTKDVTPRQAPSYILGLAKVGQLYKKQEFEYALIETNHLLSIYPNSPKLLKMKGSLYLRLGNPRLTIRAWEKALELEPNNKKLEVAVERLKKSSKEESLEKGIK